MNHITEYSQKLSNGEIKASRRIKAVYSRLAAAVTEKGGQYVFDENKAQRPIAFIERFCKHSKGEWPGKPVLLELFQKHTLKPCSALLTGKQDIESTGKVSSL